MLRSRVEKLSPNRIIPLLSLVRNITCSDGSSAEVVFSEEVAVSEELKDGVKVQIT